MPEFVKGGFKKKQQQQKEEEAIFRVHENCAGGEFLYYHSFNVKDPMK